MQLCAKSIDWIPSQYELPFEFTSSKNGVLVFISTMLVTYFITDVFKIAAAKRLRNKLTPKRIYKTKKVVALVILGFGLLLLTQGLFPNIYEKGKEHIERVNPIKSRSETNN